MKKRPGRNHCKGLTTIELFEMFHNRTAEHGLRNNTGETVRVARLADPSISTSQHTRPWSIASTVARNFSVFSRVLFWKSNIGPQKWAIGLYTVATSLMRTVNETASRTEHSQKSAWFMLTEIREAFVTRNQILLGAVELHETYIGDKERNKHSDKKLKMSRGAIGKQVLLVPRFIQECK